MKAEEFIKDVYKNTNEDYGILAPPTDAQHGLNILINHFLGEDWYATTPISNAQVNTEAIYEMLKKYPKHKVRII